MDGFEKMQIFVDEIIQRWRNLQMNCSMEIEEYAACRY